MSAVGGGQFYAGQAQSLLSGAAQDETQRNMQNKALKQEEKAANSQLGATAGAVAGFAIGGPVGAGIGAVAGGLLGRVF